MNILFNLDNEKFTKYWEGILDVGNLQYIALKELASLQQLTDCKIHISGNLTELNANWLNTKIADLGLNNVEYTCSYLEGTLVDAEYVSNNISVKYPLSSYNIIDLRGNKTLTPDLFRENPRHTIAPRSTLMKLTP